MNATTSVLLLLAACLEVGGDAIVRSGLHSQSAGRFLIIGAGGVVLLAYGVFVNVAPADFGRLLGAYVVIFFVVAQLVNAFGFGIKPDASIVVGGILILAGGLVITLWQPT